MNSEKVTDANLLDELIILEKIKRKRDRKIQLMLISDDMEMKKLHYYIFSSAKDVDYYTLDDLSPEDISFVYEMDIIIFNKDDDELKESLLGIIKTQKLDSKFFEISNRKYLRQRDLLIAHNSGIHKLLPKDFKLEEYVMSIEIFLKTNFYTKRLLSLKQNSESMISSKELFENRKDELLDKKIFFSSLRYAYESDIDIAQYNLQKIVRENDTIYYDTKKRELSFLILNTAPTLAKTLIKKRVENFSITLELQEHLSSFELVYEES